MLTLCVVLYVLNPSILADATWRRQTVFARPLPHPLLPSRPGRFINAHTYTKQLGPLKPDNLIWRTRKTTHIENKSKEVKHTAFKYHNLVCIPTDPERERGFARLLVNHSNYDAHNMEAFIIDNFWQRNNVTDVFCAVFIIILAKKMRKRAW